MGEQENNVNIAVLANEVKNLGREIAEMKSTLNDLRLSFPTRSEFDVVKIAVMGVANDGGLVNRVDLLEKRQSERKGSWSTIQIIWTVCIAIIMAVLAYVSIVVSTNNYNHTTTNINTSSK